MDKGKPIVIEQLDFARKKQQFQRPKQETKLLALVGQMAFLTAR